MDSSFLFEAAIATIQQYIDDWLFEPKQDWPDDWFAYRSYSRWAAFEILERIMNQPQRLPLAIVEEFRIEMESYSDTVENDTARLAFSIAKDTSIDISLLFL